MKKKTQKLLHDLIDQIEDKRQFLLVHDQLFNRGIESLFKAEISAHLDHTPGSTPRVAHVRNGYSEKTIKSQNGEHRIKVPRDRADDFDPVILPKHKCVSQELEECIILLYADGMNCLSPLNSRT